MSAARELAIPDHLRRLALIIARGFCAKTPVSVLREDLEQAAIIGAWKAVERHGSDIDLPLAKLSIRGAVIDELRKQDWLPRRTRADRHSPSHHVVVVHGEDTVEFGNWEETVDSREQPLDERLGNDAVVNRGLAVLPPRLLRVVRLHYGQGVKFADIAAELGVTEPRISQLHSRAIRQMRAALTEEEPYEHRGTDRGSGAAPEEAPPADTFVRRLQSCRLGRAASPAAARSVPRGAGGAELGRAPRPELCLARTAPRPAGPAPAADGGLPVTVAATSVEAVPSVLPEEGVDLHAELERYRDWIIDQAMVRAGHNAVVAAKLVGFSPEGLRACLRTRGIALPRARAGRKPRPVEAAPPAQPSPAPKPGWPSEATLDRIAARVPWGKVAELREGDLADGQICQKLCWELGVSKWTLEKVLARHQRRQP